MKLEGTAALVIAGAQGIGKAYCVSLLKRKVQVCCADIAAETGTQTEQELQKEFGAENFVFKTCDGTVEKQIKDVILFARSHFGRLDIVVNNVGMLDEPNWHRTIDVNFGTTVRVTNAVFEIFGKDKGGSGAVLAHTASYGGIRPAFYCPVYTATKAAMIHYVRSWSDEFNFRNHGVRMFTLCPTMTDTQFVSSNLDGKKIINKEVAEVVFNPTDTSKLLRPEWVGDALIVGLEDDSLNGVAITLLEKEPQILYKGENLKAFQRGSAIIDNAKGKST